MIELDYMQQDHSNLITKAIGNCNPLVTVKVDYRYLFWGGGGPTGDYFMDYKNKKNVFEGKKAISL